MRTQHSIRRPVAARRVLKRRQKTLALGVLLALGIAGVLAVLLVGCMGANSAPVFPLPAAMVQALQTADVQKIVQAAANSANIDMVVAVVDRVGFVLGVFRTQNAPTTALMWLWR
jgi:hypothetical protein